ncbi:hypothetical protein [Streptomyces sp. Ag109_G2-15]|uniref:hypothetical protein n=1 Tax=Streptomyces sp. Ag109_G2-15 TaxID=1938850 RepID=UPI001180BD91|nr:hypothetical protein [Streptomyces sp. Ag109_G2-15]
MVQALVDLLQFLGTGAELGFEHQGAVGCVRYFRLYRVIRARERIIVWDPGRRFAYCAQEANAPGVLALLEEWTLTPSTDLDRRHRLQSTRPPAPEGEPTPHRPALP